MANPNRVSTVIQIKKFFGMSTKEMTAEFSPLSAVAKLEFSDMLHAVGIVPTDRARYLKNANAETAVA